MSFTWLAAVALLHAHVNIGRVDGPHAMPKADIERVMRAVRRQYRRDAKVKLWWEWREVKGTETGNYFPDVQALSGYAAIYRDRYWPSIRGGYRPALLIVPPFIDREGYQYGGGASSLHCAPRWRSGGFGIAAMGDTPRQWDLAPTLLGHELGHQLAAVHTREGLMHPNALTFVQGSKLRHRPRMTLETVRAIRSCLGD